MYHDAHYTILFPVSTFFLESLTPSALYSSKPPAYVPPLKHHVLYPRKTTCKIIALYILTSTLLYSTCEDNDSGLN